jgi:CelD/BcsL family acetyltransferase involved in cellulose biosynthesis
MRVLLTDDPTAMRTRDWTSLVDVDPSGTFFHTPAYLKLWWEEFGTGQLVLAFVLDGKRTVGACALEIVDGSLRFLGGFDVSDYMGPVSIPGMEEAAAKELVAAMTTELAWTSADLRGLAIDSAWLAALAGSAAAGGLHVHEGDDGVAPRIELPTSYEAYLSSLPSKLRHEIRRKERRLVQELGPYAVALATRDSLSEDFGRFIELHKASPGRKGRFMLAGMEIFFRRLGEAFLPDHVFHLATLEVGGRKVAGAIGFAYKNVFSLYNSAFDREFAALSPGMVLVADMIERAVASGRSTFDMLKGDLAYKYRFGSQPRPVRRLVLARE